VPSPDLEAEWRSKDLPSGKVEWPSSSRFKRPETKVAYAQHRWKGVSMKSLGLMETIEDLRSSQGVNKVHFRGPRVVL
jgi:hypothetical protein